MCPPKLLLPEITRLRQLASKLAFNPCETDDIVQETLVRALDHHSTEIREPRQWLETVLRNLVHDWHRRESKRSAVERHAARKNATPSTGELVEIQATESAALAAMHKLREPYLSTIRLRYLNDLPPRRIAQRLGVPVETIRTRLKRGLAKLRTTMEEAALCASMRESRTVQGQRRSNASSNTLSRSGKNSFKVG